MLIQQWLWTWCYATITVKSEHKYVIVRTPSETTADEGLTSICEIDWLPFFDILLAVTQVYALIISIAFSLLFVLTLPFFLSVLLISDI